ncbi:ATP-dependent DNA helicase [Gracilibacillus halophilus YIM-C55.5]|uniref:ATP-dependent DNA helicase n=1 Tax=Gracilibacillus halophilus YIM-C55.5 TaxID=1308866 RepID=N4WWA7_9BACI|nr:ATP-dependent DNA helicase RecQ [Gracilibacillus halophilus]ENH97366.1 ATP-dependent DNA helicase [Gracilibacillus halophilus YIM-C55.5]
MGELEEYLYHYFGYSTFRNGQKEIIEDVNEKKDVLAVLPTGSGKSICYQLPAMMNEGMVLVVSPLLSLMEDQVKQMRARGFKRVIALNSMMAVQERNRQIQHLHQYQLVYVSPEMLQNRQLTAKLSRMSIQLFVIDEAHCISQWGHEFRPDYLRLQSIHKQLHAPPILALTATATPDVQHDIMSFMGMRDVNKHIHPMDKPNIAFLIERVNHQEKKLDYISSLLSSYQVPTMIYFSSRKEAERISLYLDEKVEGLRVAYYHGGLDTQDRILIQQQFMYDQLDVICCTSAFGMGIDKQNVRLVIHYHMPAEVESFIQEVGRAGRDGEESISVLLYHEHDRNIPQRLIDSELPNQGLLQEVVDWIFHRQSIPIHEVESYIIEKTGNETPWRFIHYQLEQIGMKNNSIFLSETYSKQWVLSQLQNAYQQRLQYKISKLLTMEQWVLQDEMCRREALFQYFQDMITPPNGMCCDQCDFRWDHWKTNRTVNNQEETASTWKNKLAQLLLQETEYEI